MASGYVFWISNHFLWSFCLRLMYCILFPTGKRHGYHPATSFHAKFLHEKRCPLNIPHHLGRSPLMAWQPLQQPCLQPTPRFPTCFFPWLYRSNMLNSRGFWGNVWNCSKVFWGIFRGWFQQRNCGFTKVTLMWSWPNMVGDAQMRHQPRPA